MITYTNVIVVANERNPCNKNYWEYASLRSKDIKNTSQNILINLFYQKVYLQFMKTKIENSGFRFSRGKACLCDHLVRGWWDWHPHI